MKISEEAQRIVGEIISIHDKLNIPYIERGLYEIPMVNAYFKGMRTKQDEKLVNEVYYGLAIERVK